MRHLHWYFIALFVLVLGYDLVVWGAASHLPDEVGPRLLRSAQREAPLAFFYMQVGGVLDTVLPPLQAWGEQHAHAALGEGFARISEDPAVAMDLVFSQTWNSQHALLKSCHWAAPILLVLSLVFWVRRPKKVHLMAGRRR